MFFIRNSQVQSYRGKQIVQNICVVMLLLSTQVNPNGYAMEESCLQNVLISDKAVSNWQEYQAELVKGVPVAFSLPSRDLKVSFSLKQIAVSTETQVGQLYEYSYLLEGWDKTWSVETTFPIASYQGLPPGEYVWRLKARKPGMKSFQEEKQSIRFKVNEPLWQKWWIGLSIGILGIIGGVLLALRASKKLPTPTLRENIGAPTAPTPDTWQTEKQALQAKIEQLEQQARQFDEKYQKVAKEYKVLHDTVDNFDASAKAAMFQYEKMLNEKKTMEAQISDLEKELAAARAEIADLKSQLIMAEKLSMLGEYTASIAHDLGSPLTVIKNSVHENQQQIPSLFQYIFDFWQQLPVEARPLFMQALQVITQSRGPLTPSIERQHITKLRKQLIIASIEEAEDFADILVKAGLYEQADLVTKLLQAVPKPETLVDALQKIGRIWRQVNNIARSGDRAEKLLNMLKSYARKEGDALEATPTQIVDTIEQIIGLNDSFIRKGIEVETEYDANLPLIPAYPDELMQVWANIVSNAIYAMNGKGKLTFSVKNMGNVIQVIITDNGPGIPSDKIQKIFQKGYTDKPKGEGTGLGLAICQRVIDKHKGNIRVESHVQNNTPSDEPSFTRFIVELPLK